MSNRTLALYEEPRNEHGPHWTIGVDRSAAGRPGIFITIRRRMHDPTYSKLDQEMTIVIDDGAAFLAPVNAWLKGE